MWKKRDVYEMRSAKRERESERKFFILPGRANIISNSLFSQLITLLYFGTEDGETSTFLHLFDDKNHFSSVVPRMLLQQVLEIKILSDETKQADYSF